MPQDSYTLHLPQNPRSSVVFSSPHSGAEYRADFLSSTRLGNTEIRSSEDAFVDELFASAPDFGAPLLCGKAPRAYIDLNRAATDLDPALIQGAVIKGINPAVAGGLGVIPRVVANGQVIQAGKISMEAAQDRLARYYTPYHDRLAKLLCDQHEVFGMTVLLDCHSMPREALESAPYIGHRRPDVILGDRFGVSCDRWITDAVEQIFVSAGFSVGRNAPFAGGHITRHYGRPKRNQHALQIEISRELYMNEATLERTEGLTTLRRDMALLVEGFVGLDAECLKSPLQNPPSLQK